MNVPSTSITSQHIEQTSSPHAGLLEAFIICRTTFDDLASRVAAQGHQLSVATIAGYMTGRRTLSAARHNWVALAINSRLLELQRDAQAPYRPTGSAAAHSSSDRLPPAGAGDPRT